MELAESNEIVPHDNRTVLVVGKSGSGKSTVANKILGFDAFEVSSSLDGKTRKADKQEGTYHVVDKATGKKYDYRFKLVDTVGLFDSEFCNENAIKEIKSYMEKHVPEGANLILFVFKHGRFSPEEKETFDYIIKHFEQEIADISALVITNCDGKKDDARQEIIEEFKNNDKSKETASFMRRGIFAVGFPDLSQMEEGTVAPRTKQKIEEDAKKLRKLVRDADRKVSGETMFTENFWEKVRGMCIVL